MSLLVLHHTDDVGLGTLAEPLAARNLDLAHVDVATTPGLNLDGVTGVVVLGGRGRDPFPDHEVAALRDAVTAAVPVFAIAHDAEVLAVALGGQARARPHPAVNFLAVDHTDAGHHDDVAGWPDGTRALSLHRDEMVDPPPASKRC